MRTLLVVDGNALAARHYCAMMGRKGAQAGLETSLGIKTTMIYGVLNTLSSIPVKFDKVIICWDGGKRYRKNIFRHYKANREKESSIPDIEEYHDELNVARDWIARMGVPSLFVKGCEADDLIGLLAVMFSESGTHVTVCSDDHDYFQLLKKGVDIRLWRPSKGEFIDSVSGAEKLKYPCFLFNRVNALTGQKKDNIPGGCDLDSEGIMKLYRFGPAEAVKLLRNSEGNWNKLKEAKKALQLDNPRHAQLLRNWKGVLKSYKLSKLRTSTMEYSLEERTTINDFIKLFEEQKPITEGKLSMMAQHLEFRTLNLPQLMRKIGVRVL